MYYYKVVLPLNIDDIYVYTHKEKLAKGLRVIVGVRDKLYTGIVYSEDEGNRVKQKKINYRSIIEVIDSEALIDDSFFELANWISNYYKCSIGIVFNAMLPSAFKIECLEKLRLVKKKGHYELNDEETKILSVLSEHDWTDFNDIKQSIDVKNVFCVVERLEELGSIEIQRTFEERVKKKYGNFIMLTGLEKKPKLTDRQQLLYDIIIEHFKKTDEDNPGFPVSKIARDFSYSIVKALRTKGLIKIEARELKTIERSKDLANIIRKKTVNYTNEQLKNISIISEALKKNRFESFLLYGVTGSGKTEIYLKIIEQAFHEGKGALMLVPEISLTPQMIRRFYSFFPQEIVILHSRLSEREKWIGWRKIQTGQVRIVLGVRSAIFAPVKNLGVIIVDEEHESSYKQDKKPKYNARDLALVRGRMSDAVVILGSATPSLETWYNSLNKKYSLLELKQRPFQVKMPAIIIYDMKDEKPGTLISEKLKNSILERLELNEQVILLQNLRGYASYVICVNCGCVIQCPNCEISMNFHSYDSCLLCHYCGFSKNLSKKCEVCNSYVFDYGQAGTQKLEKQLSIFFPKARILRMDADTVNTKDSYNEMFQSMISEEIDILFGTQMIAKGLDFPNVTLVGVINADVSLNIPDFRAEERTFQLLTQVAGRSGRAEKNGEVIIQTRNPEHSVINYVKNFDYHSFTKNELSNRVRLNYPPYYRIARIIFSHKDENKLKSQVDKNEKICKSLLKDYQDNQLILLGPIPAPFYKLKERFRYHIIIKAKNYKLVNQFADDLLKNIKVSSSVKIDVDIDPYSLL